MFLLCKEDPYQQFTKILTRRPAVLLQGSVDIVFETSLKKRRRNDSVAMQLKTKRGIVVSREAV